MCLISGILFEYEEPMQKILIPIEKKDILRLNLLDERAI